MKHASLPIWISILVLMTAGMAGRMVSSCHGGHCSNPGADPGADLAADFSGEIKQAGDAIFCPLARPVATPEPTCCPADGNDDTARTVPDPAGAVPPCCPGDSDSLPRCPLLRLCCADRSVVFPAGERELKLPTTAARPALPHESSILSRTPVAAWVREPAPLLDRGHQRSLLQIWLM